uniref:Uncharacterized protein n=1 Tax=Arundo donax TaxID=35708 RepID=A0A0A8YPS8_ARUDO
MAYLYQLLTGCGL